MDTVMGIPVHMDYEGQRLAERLFHIIILSFGAAGWLYGYHVQDFFKTILMLGGGSVLACLVTLPPWPIYRRSPLKWVPVQEQPSAPTETVSSKKKKK
ncbi:signal peptidase complex subunit Spase12 [Oratosquilla oratoria]|uniref:signal peptidase complex subunit Spase12 n=1 Tax=Oratosquilla oratoria TaxID=337810 RepID=UPI003F761FF5